MQLKLEEAIISNTLGNSAMSIPDSLSPNKMFANDLDYGDTYSDTTLIEMWNQQHPLIHTWLILSSVSICFLSALLFIIH